MEYRNSSKGKDGGVFIERRKFPRLTDHVFISYRLRNNLLDEFKAVTQNISGGGAMFEAEKRIPAGQYLDLGVYQPTNRFKTLVFVIPTTARIVWTQRIRRGLFEVGENKYKMGIEFVEIGDEDRGKIMRYVEENIR